VGVFGKPMRDYVDTAELPWFALTLVLTFSYVGSFWLEVSYLTLMAPLALILQVVTAVVAAYLVGVRKGFTWQQVACTCALVGFGGGLASAVLALVRFWHYWLAFNVLVEPFWSALLGAFVGVLTVGFFQLPKLAQYFRDEETPEAR